MIYDEISLFSGSAKSRTDYKRSERYTHLVVKTAARQNGEEIQLNEKGQLKAVKHMLIWIILLLLQRMQN